MHKTQGNKPRRAAVAIAAAAVLAAGLMSATAAMAWPTPFERKLESAITQAKADANYKVIPMARTDHQWFYDECQALWEKKITKEQYVANGARQFPGYEASFAELADLLTAS